MNPRTSQHHRLGGTTVQRARITPRTRRSLTVLGAVLTVAALAGCGATATPEPRDGTATASDELSGTLTVAAAASLQEAFTELTAAFTREHPGVEFAALSTDGSSVLGAQIIAGAPVDVFASADQKNMDKVADAGLLASDPVPFATSSLEIAVPAGNPRGIATLADLARTGSGGTPPVVVICAPEVPCGAASRTLLERDGVSLRPASEEQSVSGVVTKLTSGEADAGLVYRSDVLASAGALEGIEIPGSRDAAGLYLAAPLSDSASPAAARAFAEYLASEDAQALLRRLGFGAADE